MINDVCTAKRKELLALPQKPFSEERIYEYIIIVPTRRKHESGWRLMALIGATKVNEHKYEPTELIGYCDDINWILPKDVKYHEALRTDMTLSNCTRIWSNYYKMKVGCVTSSTDIILIKEKYR